MYRKKNHKKIKVLILSILCFSILIGLSIFFSQERNYSKVEKVIRDMGVHLKSFFLPKPEPYSPYLLEGIQQQLEEENMELKKMLELNSEKYQFIHATVISRDLDWYQEITINKGEKDGIQLDMAVISNQGLIGRVSKTAYSSSVVKLLTASSDDMKIAVDIQSGEEKIHGIIDDYLEEEDVIQVNNISKNKEIKLDDKVYTNGLGGIYPSGIYVGKVVDIAYDSLGLNKIVKVKPDSSYDILRYVTVIGREEE